MEAIKQWGVRLLGHPHDLQDWADVLKQPFDPWVTQDSNRFVLRWSGFDGLGIASDVQGRASIFVEQLNGAMWIDRDTRPVRFEGIVAFNPDGTHQTFIMAEAHAEARARVTADAIVIKADGTVAPPPPPKLSDVQEWVALAESDELLSDALFYFARAGWFDFYKAFECIRQFAGGEAKLRDLNWISRNDLTRLKQTANSFRHRRGDGKNAPPPEPMEQNEARQLLAILIRKALIHAKCRTNAAAGNPSD
jgi:hypothetical protein